jgi:hypothetical protein
MTTDVQQSGNVTVGHYALWAANGVVEDGGAGPINIALIKVTATGINVNSANTDNSIGITLPSSADRYAVESVIISNASHSLSTATCGLFTSSSAGGTAIVTGGSAITVTATTDETNNNMQSLTVARQNTESYTAQTLYFRIGTAEGAAATGDVTITIRPLP